MPVFPEVVIPTVSDPDLDESTTLLCGIAPNTTDFVVTWTTPNGSSFTPTDLANDATTLGQKYMILNGRISTMFPQGSILTVRQLSYLDSGTYTCSVELTGTNMRDSAEIELTLLGNEHVATNVQP